MNINQWLSDAADNATNLSVWTYIAPLLGGIIALPWTFHPFFGVVFDPGIGALMLGTPASLWILLGNEPRGARITHALVLFGASLVTAIVMSKLWHVVV